jgi:hypothetical protein
MENAGRNTQLPELIDMMAIPVVTLELASACESADWDA